MFDGVLVTLGALAIIASRIMYTMYENGMSDERNDRILIMAIIADVAGTAATTLSLLDHNGII